MTLLACSGGSRADRGALRGGAGGFPLQVIAHNLASWTARLGPGRRCERASGPGARNRSFIDI